MSLTSTAHSARNLIKYGGASLILFTLVYSGMRAGIKAYRAAHPVYVAPTVRYGILPKIIFPDKEYQKKEFEMLLPNDSLPKLPDQNRVYVVYRPINTFLALDYEIKTAQNLGFTHQGVETNPGSSIYQFSNDLLNQRLTINVLDGSFHLKYPYETDQMLLVAGGAPNREEAIQNARAYLNGSGKMTTDLEGGEKKVSFWKIDFDGLKAVPAQSEAHLTRVDFFRTPLEGGNKIMTSEVNSAPVSVLLSNSTVEGKRVVEVNYKYVNIDRQSFETYPIKTVNEAVAELKRGNYWPAVDSQNSRVAIRNIYLAYFEPITLTNYMQPIFVFEGDGGFVAYVAAILDKWISSH